MQGNIEAVSECLTAEDMKRLLNGTTKTTILAMFHVNRAFKEANLWDLLPMGDETKSQLVNAYVECVMRAKEYEVRRAKSAQSIARIRAQEEAEFEQVLSDVRCGKKICHHLYLPEELARIAEAGQITFPEGLCLIGKNKYLVESGIMLPKGVKLPPSDDDSQHDKLTQAVSSVKSADTVESIAVILTGIARVKDMLEVYHAVTGDEYVGKRVGISREELAHNLARGIDRKRKMKAFQEMSVEDKYIHLTMRVRIDEAMSLVWSCRVSELKAICEMLGVEAEDDEFGFMETDMMKYTRAVIRGIQVRNESENVRDLIALGATEGDIEEELSDIPESVLRGLLMSFGYSAEVSHGVEEDRLIDILTEEYMKRGIGDAIEEYASGNWTAEEVSEFLNRISKPILLEYASDNGLQVPHQASREDVVRSLYDGVLCGDFCIELDELRIPV